MFVILIVIAIILLLLSIIVIYIGNVEYDLYVKEVAETTSFEEIERKINEDTELVNSKRFKGTINEKILDHKEFWENVKEIKNGNYNHTTEK